MSDLVFGSCSGTNDLCLMWYCTSVKIRFIRCQSVLVINVFLGQVDVLRDIENFTLQH
jgi:hypothetical protein